MKNKPKPKKKGTLENNIKKKPFIPLSEIQNIPEVLKIKEEEEVIKQNHNYQADSINLI
ncbi:MAG: hypothetical protein H7321_00235 [Bacteroidia bacterium]|nr:hypothetical protein [Bacteroidia bacterium]